ncbi:MAG: DNA polymerase III subunit chi [Hylemonella sp.]|jgi:DNA polymerase-3 subunit chi
MTQVDFHFNVPDKMQYACRLLRKAVNSGAKVVVTGPGELLQQLDVQLWTFSQTDFIAHALLPDPHGVAAASDIVLTEQARLAEHRQVLLNLADSIPQDLELFERLVEIVSLEDADRTSARSRWKHYTGLGLELIQHDLAKKSDNLR